MQKVMVREGGLIFKQDSEADFLYYISSGKVAIYREYIDVKGLPKHNLLRVLERGETFGEIAIFSKEGSITRTATAKALTACDLIKFSKNHIQEALWGRRDEKDEYSKILANVLLKVISDLGMRFVEKDKHTEEEMTTNDFMRVCYIIYLCQRENIDYEELVQAIEMILNIKTSTIEKYFMQLSVEGLISISEPDSQKQRKKLHVENFNSFLVFARKLYYETEKNQNVKDSLRTKGIIIS